MTQTESTCRRYCSLVVLGLLSATVVSFALAATSVGFGQRVAQGPVPASYHGGFSLMHEALLTGSLWGLCVASALAAPIVWLRWPAWLGRTAVGFSVGSVAGLVVASVKVSVNFITPHSTGSPLPGFNVIVFGNSDGYKVWWQLIGDALDPALLSLAGGLLGLAIALLTPPIVQRLGWDVEAPTPTDGIWQRFFGLIVLGVCIGAITCSALEAVRIRLGHRIMVGRMTSPFHDDEAVSTVIEMFFYGLFWGLPIGTSLSALAITFRWPDWLRRTVIGVSVGAVTGIVAATYTLNGLSISHGHSLDGTQGFADWSHYQVSWRIVSPSHDVVYLGVAGAILGWGLAYLSYFGRLDEVWNQPSASRNNMEKATDEPDST